ncbi:MAG: fumarate hydratase C-terminal domain-containing protein [Vulcanimicrobiaceae bacterium]
MANHTFDIPLTEENVRLLRVGDFVHLNGLIHTGRGLYYEHVLDKGNEPPIDVAVLSNVQMHGAPAAVEDAPGVYRLSSIQATASFRYWKWVPAYVERYGIRAIIGKAGMDSWVYEDVFSKTGTVFLTTVGYGIAALYGRAVRGVRDVFWKEELGLPEAMWLLDVENFGPFIVDGDCTGASLAAMHVKELNERFAEQYAKLSPHILKRIGEIDSTLRSEVIEGRSGCEP